MNGRETEIDGVIKLLSVYPQREARINKKWRQRKIGTATVAVAQEPIPQERAIVVFQDFSQFQVQPS